MCSPGPDDPSPELSKDLSITHIIYSGPLDLLWARRVWLSHSVNIVCVGPQWGIDNIKMRKMESLRRIPRGGGWGEL